MEEPWGVALNQRGEVVVTEKGRDCVTVFSPRGEKLFSFGMHGSSHGRFKYPRDVAVDAEGNILEVDRNNHHIQKFTEKGKFIVAVGVNGGCHGEFYYPSGIAISPVNNKVYVTDSWNGRVQVLNPSSVHLGRKATARDTLFLH